PPPPPPPPPPPAGTWTQIATEGQSFAVTGTQTVRFGAGSSWVQRSVTTTGACTVAFFGSDPAPTVSNVCQVLQPVVNPPVTGIRWRGVSLAGAEFGPQQLPGTHGTDYIYPSVASVSYFKAKGMNTVRLPFLWERLQPSLNQPFDAAELSRLSGFVRQVTATGVTVVLDPHNYARYRGNLVGSGAVPVSAFADFWRRLALEFKSDSKVVFGLMNEPHDMPTEQWLLGANAAIAAIRNAGATNVLTVPGNAWTGAHSWNQSWYGQSNASVMQGIVDPAKNLVIEVHQYLDADSSGTSPNCVSAQIGPQRLAEFTAWARSKGYRAFLGEFGAASNDTCNQAVANTLTYLQSNTDVWAGWSWWAAGPWWGSYMYSIEPSGTQDKPQMSVLRPYLQ
ncbi:MAG: endoglucanase precursor (endo,4-beta-glucanase)(cellulase) protein, partial [Pseudomonadota bacterium]